MAAPEPVPLPARSKDPDAASSGVDQPRGAVRRLLARSRPLLLALGCGAAAWALLGGRLTGRTPTRGYAEAIPLVVASAHAGRVAEVKATLGAEVKRGQEVARLDSSDLQARRARLEAEREVARAKLVAAGEIQDASVLRSELWQLRTVAAARRDQAELAALDREVERLESLYKDQLVRAAEIEPVRRQREALAARVRIFNAAALAGRAGLGHQKVGTDAHAEVVNQRLEPLREQLRVAEAAVAELEVQLAASILRAPDDGVVTSVDHHAGEVVAAGAPVVTLTAGRPGVVVAFVPEARAAAVRVGDRVTVSGRTPLLSGRRPGRVIEAGPDVTELPLRFRISPSLPAWGRRVVIQTEGGTWLPGEEIRVAF